MYVLNLCLAICLLYGLIVAFSFIDGLCIKCFHLTVIVDIFWVEALPWVAWAFIKVVVIALNGCITAIILLISI